MSQSRGSFSRARIFSRTNSEISSLASSSKNNSANDASHSLSEPSSQMSSRISRRRSGEHSAQLFSKSCSKPVKVGGRRWVNQPLTFTSSSILKFESYQAALSSL